MSDSLPVVAEAAALTAALQRAGVLGDACVSEVKVESTRPTMLSRIIRLRVSYDGSAANAPASLILKTGSPERIGPGWNAGRQEVAFYTKVAPAVPGIPVPRCFDAQWDKESQAWHLLLEDLTESHSTPTAWPVPPSMAQCSDIVAVLARCHAAFWDHPQLGAGIGVFADDAAIDRDLATFAERYGKFAERLGDNLSAERRALYEQFIDASPRLLGRYRSRRHVTIAHGDAHAWNCLLPRDGSAGTVPMPGPLMFDWDSWDIAVPTDDLAYLMAMHWYPDRRRRLERKLLDRYHAALVAAGVEGYDRTMLDDDYRLSVLWLICPPVTQWSNNIPPVIWWNNLERAMLAVEDLDARALLA